MHDTGKEISHHLIQFLNHAPRGLGDRERILFQLECDRDACLGAKVFGLHQVVPDESHLQKVWNAKRSISLSKLGLKPWVH